MVYTRTTIAIAILLNTLLAGVVLVSLLGCGQVVPPGTPKYTVSDPAVVRLLIIDDSGGTGQCTAWKVGPELVMTAGHCCTPDNVAYSAEGPHAVLGSSFTPVVVDAKHDACVLRGKITGDAIVLAAKDPEIGERVWTSGFPHGTFLISDGFWSGRDSDGNGVASTTVGGGASGSPVMNVDGQAVGILVAKYRDMDGLTFISTIEWARAALARAELKLATP
jgi:hypothetical protein